MIAVLLAGCNTGNDITESIGSEPDIVLKDNDPGKDDNEMNDKIEYEFEKIPDEYYNQASQQGSLERFDYVISDSEENIFDKYALVYLPYGYEKDATEKYNILYLIHGGSGNPDTLFGGLNGRTDLKNILDNMIEKGDIEPLIVVTPSYYNGREYSGMSGENRRVREFQQELSDYLIPAIEAEYHTYAEPTDHDSLVAARDHRAIGGFFNGWCYHLVCLH